MRSIQDKQGITEAAGKRSLASYWGMWLISEAAGKRSVVSYRGVWPRTLGSEAQDSRPDLLAVSGTCQAASSLRAFALPRNPDVCTDGPLWVSV